MTAFVETMAYAGETPWHGLGVKLSEEAKRDPRKMIVEAGLDWRVKEIPIFYDGTPGIPDGSKRFNRIARYKAIQRETDDKVLGVVTSKYVPYQNEDAFDWFLPFIEAGEAEFHTAGSLKEGKRVWVLAKLNRDPLVIKGDDAVDKYLMLAHGHDGRMSIVPGLTPVRIVCWNTLQMALEHDESVFIKVRHTLNAKDNLEKVREVINVANQRFEATAEQYRKLAAKGIHQGDVLKYVQLVFDVKEKEDPKIVDGIPQLFTPQSKKLIDRIEELTLTGRGNTGDPTWWHLYNGVTEYLNYERGRSQETRLDSLWFGEGTRINKKALETALVLAA